MRPLLLCAVLLAAAGCSSVPRSGASKGGGAVVDWAQRSIGRPYKSAGRSPDAGFDCSGLAWWTHHQTGIDIPVTSATQFRGGREVQKKLLLPGDLVFFSTERRGPSHVGVYIGKGRFIHAPKTGSTVSISSLEETYWSKRYIGARRYW